MTKAVKCPVCGGDGRIWPMGEGSYSLGYKVTCHGCDGKGWVEVRDELGYYKPPENNWIK